ncbi:hypothetical protein G7008_03540 [Pseudomonas psychrotolerans]|uniref:hypothetical protein n=1 Tax=Pseudomonas oryzihabitans TaxID=47885 RepID=UPI0015E43EC0|nr:hypothetical protein [Pseudomonas psychrotolerans]MBA1179568.1 hypothetical protein [Pseudomonas psychrotolerans]MBA1212171.1 hypothetical protein [Pseudomonas psychrotolerans]
MSNLEIGKTYAVNHQRKGRFTGRLLVHGDVWSTFEITEGTAGAMCPSNIAERGEEITVRNNLCNFEPL